MSPPGDREGRGKGGAPSPEGAVLRLLQGLRETLPRERWFAEKSAELSGVSVADRAALGDASAPETWLLLRVDFRDRPPSFYSAFFRVEGETMLPAEDDPGVVSRLLAGFANAARIPTENGSLSFRPIPGSEGMFGDAVRKVRRIASEQSNTSVVIDGRMIHKHLRRIAPGENPDVEVPEYLWTRTSFRNIPRPLGSVAYAGPGFPEALVGTTQVFVPNEGDLWTHVLRALAGNGGLPPLSLLPVLTELGSVTGWLHAALASAPPELPAFSPEPVREDDVLRWQAAWDATFQRARLELSRGLAHLSPETRPLAEEVADRLPLLPPKVALHEGGWPKGSLRTRIHGDYHLGQVMRTPEELIILDFEGEPLRSLEERRAKQSPLKDVAGMLRSLDYAAHAAVRASPPASDRSPPDPSIAARSSRGAQDLFLEGYWSVAAAARPGWADPKDPDLPRLLEFFVTEKALYELCYELQYRPAWTDIPLRALLKAIG
jgi:maltose alpha-D-glucosyltransferase/alpha-amylase